MISLKDWMTAIDYRITEGSDYNWNCYGSTASTLDSWNGSHDSPSSSVIFDRKTQVVYEAQVFDYNRGRAYRRINPAYAQSLIDEAALRNSDHTIAYDNVKFIDLEVDEDFLEKLQAIMLGETYDDRISVPLQIPKDDLLNFMLAAHERDMTFNDFVEEALRAVLAEFKSDPEGMIQQAEELLNV